MTPLLALWAGVGISLAGVIGIVYQKTVATVPSGE
jgi:hypothetical protein